MVGHNITKQNKTNVLSTTIAVFAGLDLCSDYGNGNKGYSKSGRFWWRRDSKRS